MMKFDLTMENGSRISYENEVEKPIYEIKDYSKILIPRRAEEKEKSYWIKPTRGKGVHFNIPKSLCKTVKLTDTSFEAYVPNWFIDKSGLNSYIEN